MLSKYIHNRIFSYIGLNSNINYFRKKQIINKKKKLEDKVDKLSKEIKKIDDVENTLKYYQYIKNRIKFIEYVNVVPPLSSYVIPVFTMIKNIVSTKTINMLKRENIIEYTDTTTCFRLHEFNEDKAKNFIHGYMYPINPPLNINKYMINILGRDSYTIKYYIVYPLFDDDVLYDINFIYIRDNNRYKKYLVDTDIYEQGIYLVHKNKLKIEVKNII